MEAPAMNHTGDFVSADVSRPAPAKNASATAPSVLTTSRGLLPIPRLIPEVITPLTISIRLLFDELLQPPLHILYCETFASRTRHKLADQLAQLPLPFRVVALDLLIRQKR